MEWVTSVMIFALAGRRIDPSGSSRNCFPLRNVELVRSRLDALFRNLPGKMLVCSAACGADLLALEVAGTLAWDRRVILPFDRDRFRKSSVTDRPGNWGALYDQVLDEVQAAHGLIVEQAPAGANDYEAASQRILSETQSLAAVTGEDRAAVVVWEGTNTGPGDMTNRFAESATTLGLPLLQINTLE
jgi:hypothetical protein